MLDSRIGVEPGQIRTAGALDHDLDWCELADENGIDDSLRNMCPSLALLV